MELEGRTIRVITEEGSLYITLNWGADGRVREVFLELGKAGTEVRGLVEAIGRLLNFLLRRGVRLEDVVEVLEGIRAGGVVWQEGGGKVQGVVDGIVYGIRRLLEMGRLG